jgi:hypothetical protein
MKRSIAIHSRWRLQAGQAGVRFLAAKSVGASDNEAMAMTEQEWLACSDPQAMLEVLRQTHRLTARKWRLFGVACCHRIPPLLTDERSLRAVAVAERFADGEASATELSEAFDAAFDAGAVLAEERERDPTVFVAADRDPLRNAAWATSEVAHPDESPDSVAFESASATVPAVERNAQSTLLWCLFGNPFRPVALSPTWQTSTVTALAQAIYADRAFERLPILADALEDAGCDNADILKHCRQPGEHVRGCWVVDLVLGKE